MKKRWETYEHEADMGVRGFGDSKDEAFEQAALAVTAVVADPAAVRPRDEVTFHCEAADDEALFAAWVNSVVHEMSSRNMLFSRFALRLQEGRLSAQAWGEPVDPARHHPARPVKGANHTALRVVRHAEGWMAQTVVAI
jgi:tRNA nucleotidyltransferase (CCA-adding enzyme)